MHRLWRSVCRGKHWDCTGPGQCVPDCSGISRATKTAFLGRGRDGLQTCSSASASPGRQGLQLLHKRVREVAGLAAMHRATRIGILSRLASNIGQLLLCGWCSATSEFPANRYPIWDRQAHMPLRGLCSGTWVGNTGTVIGCSAFQETLCLRRTGQRIYPLC